MLANNAGRAIFTQQVDAGTFLGPPIVALGDSLTSTNDPRFIAMATFASDLGKPFARPEAPLIVADVNEPTGPLLDALRAYARLFEPAQAIPWRWSNGNGVENGVMCGPIFAIPSLNFAIEIVADYCWQLSLKTHRVSCSHMYGIGMFAVGAGEINGATGQYDVGIDPRPTAPIYKPDKTNLPGALQLILKVWRRGGPVTLESYARLAAIDTDRFGISRKVHPALVPFLVL